MVNFKFNAFVKANQSRFLVLIVVVILALFIIIGSLLNTAKPKKTQKTAAVDVTGLVDASFTDALEANALTAQQSELEAVKLALEKMQKKMEATNTTHQKELQDLSHNFETKIMTLAISQAETAKPQNGIQVAHASTDPFNTANDASMWQEVNKKQRFDADFKKTRKLNVVSFRKKQRRKSVNYLNPAHYVPSNTSVKAVVLGGADADASVNGQSKNNGVMLFKFLENGTLPNGQRSRLSGCRVSANSYGDISSERAFGTLYKLSCARPGEPIIDKAVTGWVFHNGKVGIKGQPLMRDNKVMQWAGVSGALSGIAQAAQYAQSVQQFGAFGAQSVVPSGNIAPFAAYGGASKAADVLSQYYIKRAEQYHPVIQVGAGNEVTIVFKDGFYLEPEEEHIQHAQNKTQPKTVAQTYENNQNLAESDNNFSVPPEVLNHIDRTYAQSAQARGGY